MKQTVINTFAIIGIVTTFVLACSAALNDDDATITESTETVATITNESTTSNNTSTDNTTSESTTSNNTTTNNTTTIAQSVGKYQLAVADNVVWLLNTETAEVKLISNSSPGGPRWNNPGTTQWYNHQ